MTSVFSAPKPPANIVKEPAPMPSINDAAVKKAKLNQIVQASQRSGRASTLLSGAADKLGG